MHPTSIEGICGPSMVHSPAGKDLPSRKLYIEDNTYESDIYAINLGTLFQCIIQFMCDLLHIDSPAAPAMLSQ